jgi:hypothetical protein
MHPGNPAVRFLTQAAAAGQAAAPGILRSHLPF